MAEVEVVTTPLLSFPPAERLVGHTDNVSAVAYSPDGSRIVSGSSDNMLKIWDANSGKLLSVYAALLYPPTAGYFVTIKENKEFSLPNDILPYRPKIELSGTKTLYPLEMEIRPSMLRSNNRHRCRCHRC
ncbi:WD40 repeat domain-containing protein [Candidatus Marithrix sp. Canyon 246]|uniref:WD40 repeat domain-containing protein n=1 Tax=Candidatus Marithrix sp. Canyon 246 TaxID=1827136 RepID=UPI001C0BB9FA|nr:hypothetical protein [Candidatus Marithrix sp. Canyon 246]